MEPLLAARGITKRFPGVVALDRVDLEVYPGEIHAVLGQNGAGKTTLMNILFGLLQPDEGALYLRGRRVHFRSPHDAIIQGIGMVHQTRRLVAAHTVLENIILGHPRARGLLSLRELRLEVEALAVRYGLRVDLDARIWQLSEGERQWVEVIKALYSGARILILDEPTSALTPPEVEPLLAGLRTLVQERGVTVLIVTHKLPIVIAASKRVTVLRSGEVVARLNTVETTEDGLVQHMVGRYVPIPVRARSTATGSPVLEVEDLAALNDKGLIALRGISLSLHESEALGVAGVAGNGQEELVQVLAGLRPAAGGRIRFSGRDITALSPLARWQLGIGYIPAERYDVASVAELSLVENTALNYHFDREFIHRGLLDEIGLDQLTRFILSAYNVRAPNQRARARQLSGGNLQKLILGRVLGRRPRLLIAHLPTQGLDVEATASVRARLLDAKADGTAILLISEDLDEIHTLCDWVAPIYEGRLTAILPNSEADAETVGAMMAGLQRQAGTA
ncbi:MAG: ABC transporter ATP-binding protein [Armatimonadota bacterium]|nr:ABC transporter ATP-binding protein [Armatimonadota bacterium]